MSFIWPVMLVSLVFLPLFVLLYFQMQRRRQRLASSLGSLGLVQGALGQRPGIRRHIPPALFLAGFATLAFSLARPQAEVNLPRVEGTVILTFDVSGSMAADDLKPNRMEASKAAAIKFVQGQPSSVKIGVVAFSEGGFSVQAPTDDRQAILASIARLKPERGTSLAHGILASLDAIAANSGGGSEASAPQQGEQDPAGSLSPDPAKNESYRNAIIVLISDGENTAPPDPFAAAQLASDHEVRVYTVGIGSPAGAVLQIEGFTIQTMLDEASLQQIAQITGGAYFNAANEGELNSIYTNLIPHLVIKPEKMEVTSLFATASIVLLLIGGAFSLLWFSRLP